MFTSEKMVKFLREKYPPGTRIRLVSMEDPYAPVAPGTEGTLVCVVVYAADCRTLRAG